MNAKTKKESGGKLHAKKVKPNQLHVLKGGGSNSIIETAEGI